jgi:CBS domain-containing membrane protein
MKMIQQIDSIASIMNVQVVSLASQHSLREAERLFRSCKVKYLPVLEGDELVGMLSFAKLLECLLVETCKIKARMEDVAAHSQVKIEAIMQRNPVKIPVHLSIRGFVKILANHEFYALPVVDNEKLVGVVTTTDLLHYLVKK